MIYEFFKYLLIFILLIVCICLMSIIRCPKCKKLMRAESTCKKCGHHDQGLYP